MKKNRTASFVMGGLLLLVFFLPSVLLGAESLTVDQIVERANLAAYYAGKDGRATVKMVITDA